MNCLDSSDCGWHADCLNGTCKAFHLGDLLGADAAMGAIAFLVAGLSLAAGVGGGGLFVPLLMIVLSFDAVTASALSQAMLLGGALAAFAYNLSQSHPRVKARPLVDYELACLMGPALMSGAQVGAVLHAMAPPAVVVILLCIVLIDAARKGVSQAIKISGSEQKVATTPAREAPTSPFTTATSDSESSTDSDDESATERIRDAKCKLFCVWIFCLAVVCGKGLFTSVCSPQWWLLTGTATLALGGFAFYYAYTKSQQKPVDEFSVDFRELAFVIARWSLLAGAVAALCGIGGGMVMGPILVGLKVPPPVSSATTATTLLVLSSSICLVYVCRNIAPPHYSLFLSLCTATGAVTGKTLVGWWVRRTGKESLIVWCLAGITIASTLLMGSLGVIRTWENGASYFHFKDLCVSDMTEHHSHR
mmetsp:Transcript_46946/g.132402  ORF Transcript_46946/g.132402 Transcript_46946/m.132402 type:complete len:420 (-) Transcript_46946:262-1521(-)